MRRRATSFGNTSATPTNNLSDRPIGRPRLFKVSKFAKRMSYKFDLYEKEGTINVQSSE
jgi:hypothetical protein